MQKDIVWHKIIRLLRYIKTINIKCLFIVLFMMFLCLPLFQQKTNFFKYQTLEEKRQRIPFPILSWKDSWNGQLTKNLEDFYADNFGFRDIFIQLNNTINLKLFAKAPSQDIILGKDGWLFLTNEQSDYEKKSINPKELEYIVQKLERFSDELQSQGIEFFFLIPPNKSTLYPEFMSDSVSKPKYGAQSNLELLNTELIKSNKLHYLDLRPLLFEEKENYQMYPDNDSHWTYIGSYFVSKEILKELNEISNIEVDMPEINMEEYKLFDQLWGGEGDIEKLLGTFRATTILEAKQPEITFSGELHQFPKILWYQTSFSDKLKPFITPYCSDIQFFHFQGEPMKITLKQNLSGTKIIVFELTERWLGELVSYEFPETP